MKYSEGFECQHVSISLKHEISNKINSAFFINIKNRQEQKPNSNK